MTNFLLKAYTKAQILREDHGQDLIEYALIAALVSVMLVASLGALRTGIAGVFTDVVTAFG